MPSTGPSDRIFPNQDFNSNLYDGDRSALEMGIYSAIMSNACLQHPNDRFELMQSDLFSVDEMASSPISLSILSLLVELSGAKNILEIGAFIGVSAMNFALAAGPDGHVTTLEKFDQFAEIAETNFKNNNLDDRITLICGDAKDLLFKEIIDRPVDLAFIDGNKEHYDEYIKLVTPLMAERATIIVDDIFFHGDVVNSVPTTDKGAGVRRAFEMAPTLPGWQPTVLPISNGLLILRKTP
jgi:caffeoyl-CoA O-methyltransferase